MMKRILKLKTIYLWTKDLLYKLKVLTDEGDLETMPMISQSSPMAVVHQSFLDKRKAKLNSMFRNRRNRRNRR